jgi:hypothetical protein
MNKLNKIIIEIRKNKIPFVLSPMLKYACYKDRIFLFSLPLNVETIKN